MGIKVWDWGCWNGAGGGVEARRKAFRLSVFMPNDRLCALCRVDFYGICPYGWLEIVIMLPLLLLLFSYFSYFSSYSHFDMSFSLSAIAFVRLLCSFCSHHFLRYLLPYRYTIFVCFYVEPHRSLFALLKCIKIHITYCIQTHSNTSPRSYHVPQTIWRVFHARSHKCQYNKIVNIERKTYAKQTVNAREMMLDREHQCVQCMYVK